MDPAECPGTCIHRRHWFGINDTLSPITRIWAQLPEIIGGGLCFGIGYGIFDANNMPILCQFISPRYRATAYGIMNMTGVFAGAAITDILGKSTDAGNLGHDFAMLAGLVLIALLIQVIFLRPKVANMTDEC